MKNSKYRPLELHLESNGNASIPMIFHEIEDVIGASLPPSARKYRSWWSNNPSNSAITRSWLAAGYKSSQVDLTGEHLVFTRSEYDDLRPPASPSSEGDPKIHPGFGCMEGTVTIVGDHDLTKPANPEWSEIVENANLYNE